LFGPTHGTKLEFMDETYPKKNKTKGMELLCGESSIILISTFFEWSIRVAEGRTDDSAKTQLKQYSSLIMLIVNDQ